MMARLIIVAILVLVPFVLLADTKTGQSETCGDVAGETAADVANVIEFCSKGIGEGAVVGAYAMESLLWVKITQAMAQAMLQDRLGSRQLMSIWMKGWRQITDSRAVTIFVELGDIEIAKGDTTWLGEDRVTLIDL